jgi:hypothetical protein
MSTPPLAIAETRPDRINQAIRNAQAGRINSTVTATLSASTTSTTVIAPTCAATSWVGSNPVTQHAANDMATTSIVAGNGQFVITHASNARVDRTFVFLVMG